MTANPLLPSLRSFSPQLRLDVSEFRREASRLGVDVSTFALYENLLEVIEAREDGGGGAAATGASSLSR